MQKQDGKTGSEESLENEETGIEVEGEATQEIDTDNVGEASVEIDIKSLMAEMEAEGVSTDALEGDKRKRLDDALEQKRIERELRELENFDFE